MPFAGAYDPSASAPTSSPGSSGVGAPTPWSGGAASSGGGVSAAPAASGGGTTDVSVAAPVDLAASLKAAGAGASAFSTGIGEAIGQSPVGTILQGLFGQNNGSLLGGVPVLGDVARAVGNAPGGVASAVTGAGAAIIDRVANIPMPTFGGPSSQQQFDAVPDSAAKQAAAADALAHPDQADNIRFQFTNAYNVGQGEQTSATPTLFPEFTTTAHTIGDAVSQAVGTVLGNIGRLGRRLAGGVTASNGLDRMHAIEQVATGQGAFVGLMGSDKGILGSGIGPDLFSGGSATTLTPDEQIAYTNWKAGTWSTNQAMDFLGARGQALTHDPGTQILGSIALDPTLIGSLGSGALIKLGATGMKLAAVSEDAMATARALGAADPLITAAGEAAKVGQAGLEATQAATRVAVGFNEGHALPIRFLNSVTGLARLGRAPGVADAVQFLATHVYTAVEANSVLDTAAHVVRAIVDPFSALATIGGRVSSIGSASVGLMSAILPKAVTGAFGVSGSQDVFKAVTELGKLMPDGGAALNDALSRNLSTFSANLGRRVIARVQNATLLAMGKVNELRASTPTDVVNQLADSQGKGFADQVMNTAYKERAAVMTPGARANMVDRLTAMYGEAGNAVSNWTTFVDKASATQLSLLHAITYGNAQERMVSAWWQAVKDIGEEAARKLNIHRFTLINTQSLTDVAAHDVLDTITKAGDFKAAGFKTAKAYKASLAGGTVVAEQIKAIDRAKSMYPELSRYVLKDDSPASVQAFVDKLQSRLDSGALMTEMKPGELARTPQAYQDHVAALRVNETGGGWKLAIRPTDDKLWGLDHDLQGVAMAHWDPYVDLVSADKGTFRAGQLLDHNVAGMPIVGKYVGGAVDWMTAGARTMGQHVDSEIIKSNAIQRFNELALERHGINLETSTKMVTRIMDQALQNKISTRGLRAVNMWDVVKDIVPAELYGTQGTKIIDPLTKLVTKGVGQREVLALTLDAFQGDMRYVGVTQKLTGVMKSLIGNKLMAGNNIAGMISEDLWPTLKFKISAIFQAQQRAESLSFNTMKGFTSPFGTKMTELTAAQKALSDRYAMTGLVRMSDMNQAEFAIQYNFGRSLEDDLNAAQKGVLANIRGAISGASNVKGAKEAGMLVTQANTMGKSLRTAMEAVGQGPMWDRYVAHMSLQAGHLVDDNHAAMAFLYQHGAAGDVLVPRFLDPTADTGSIFEHATGEGPFMSPDNLGELPILDMNALARHHQFPIGETGRVTTNAQDMKAAYQSGALTWDRIEPQLSGVAGHSADQIARIKRNLDFNLENFWSDAKSMFNMSSLETSQLRSAMQAAAKGRHMTEADFMSQMFEPQIQMGQRAKGMTDMARSLSPSALGDHRPTLGAPKQTPMEIAGLVPWARHQEAMAQQIGAAFAHHLDPSMTKTLAEAYPGAAGWSEGFMKDVLARPEVAGPVPELAKAPEGFTANPYEVPGASGHTFDPSVKREGFYHVTTNTDAFHAGAAHPGEPPAGTEGFGAKGDVANAGRTSMVMDRAASQNYLDRMSLAADAAQGRATAEDVAAGFRKAYTSAFGDQAVARMEKEIGVPQSEWAAKINTPEKTYDMAQTLDRGLVGSGVMPKDAGGHLTAPFSSALKWDKSKFGTVEFAANNKATVVRGLDRYTGEVTIAHGDLHTVRATPAATVRTPVQQAAIAGAQAELSKWADKVMQTGMLGGQGNEFSPLLERIMKIPTAGATPFDRTEQLIYHALGQAIRQNYADAFKLHYFATNRTVLERSINHPIFGMYPASYMWGKVIPEMTRFIATTPFGVPTHALLYTLTDVQRALAAQYEFDPNFKKTMDAIGGSELTYFLGYLLPGTPWDINASAPPWMRNLAKQGAANQGRLDSGQNALPIDLWGMPSSASPGGGAFETEAQYMNPLRQAQLADKPVVAMQNLIKGHQTPATDANAPDQGTPGAPPANIPAPPGNDLGGILSPITTPLHDILAGIVGGG